MDNIFSDRTTEEAFMSCEDFEEAADSPDILTFIPGGFKFTSLWNEFRKHILNRQYTQDQSTMDLHIKRTLRESSNIVKAMDINGDLQSYFFNK